MDLSARLAPQPFKEFAAAIQRMQNRGNAEFVRTFRSPTGAQMILEVEDVANAYLLEGLV